MLQGPRMNPRGMQNRFMGPGYMGRPGMSPYQMYPGQFGYGPGINQGQFPQMGRKPQSRQGGGLLSKLLGKGARNQGNGMAGMLSAGNAPARAATSGGGILKTLTDPAALNGFLSNTQKVLNTAQQFGPMIQQYGPLVRNLPSMWKLYKGLKDLPDADEQSEQEPQEDIEPIESAKAGQTDPNKTAVRKKAAKKAVPKGSSSPKLFI
jgi:hypothetical protein